MDPDWEAVSGLAAAGMLSAALATWLHAPAMADAQVRTSDPMAVRGFLAEGEIHGGAVHLGDVVIPGVTLGDYPITAIVLDFTGRLASLGDPDDHLFLEIDANWRAGYADSPDDAAAARELWVGSPWIAAAVSHRTPGVTARVALGVAPPLRSAVNPVHSLEFRLTGAWGGWDRWLVMDRMAPFGVTGLLESRLAQVDLGLDTALILGPTFGTESLGRLEDRGLWFWGCLGAWVGAHIGDIVRLGLRVQAVAWTVIDPIEGRDDFQASLVPFLRLLFPPGHAELRLQFNLDEPFGPTFLGDNNVWAVALRGGASWD